MHCEQNTLSNRSSYCTHGYVSIQRLKNFLVDVDVVEETVIILKIDVESLSLLDIEAVGIGVIKFLSAYLLPEFTNLYYL